MTNIIIFVRCIEYKLGALFIYRIVSEVHHDIIVIQIRWLLILHSCKSSQTFLIDIYPQGVNTPQQNVNSEIKL